MDDQHTAPVFSRFTTQAIAESGPATANDPWAMEWLQNNVAGSGACRLYLFVSHDLDIVRLLADRRLDPAARRARIRLADEPRSPIDPEPTVCRFYGRCPEGFDRCRSEMPVLRSIGGRLHEAACHRLEGEDLDHPPGG